MMRRGFMAAAASIIAGIAAATADRISDLSKPLWPKSVDPRLGFDLGRALEALSDLGGGRPDYYRGRMTRGRVVHQGGTYTLPIPKDLPPDLQHRLRVEFKRRRRAAEFARLSP